MIAYGKEVYSKGKRRLLFMNLFRTIMYLGYIVTVSYVLMNFLMFISSEKLHNISDEMDIQNIKKHPQSMKSLRMFLLNTAVYCFTCLHNVSRIQRSPKSHFQFERLYGFSRLF